MVRYYMLVSRGLFSSSILAVVFRVVAVTRPIWDTGLLVPAILLTWRSFKVPIVSGFNYPLIYFFQTTRTQTDNLVLEPEEANSVRTGPKWNPNICFSRANPAACLVYLGTHSFPQRWTSLFNTGRQTASILILFYFMLRSIRWCWIIRVVL